MYFLLATMFISLAVMAVVIIRKFPQMANVDVDNLPLEKEAKKKKEIMSRRIEAEGTVMLTKAGLLFRPIQKIWGKLQLQFRIYVGKIERLLRREERKGNVLSAEDQESKLNSLLNDAQMEIATQNFDKAESLFIAAIKIDPRSYEAYKGLADTYLLKNSLEEALETYTFLLQLYPKDDDIMVKIADIAEQKGDIQKAIDYLERAIVINDSLSPRFYHLAELLVKVDQADIAKEAIISAVDLEPKNPKYLDLLIEIGILCGDKDVATKGFAELRLVNPKNQKLQVFSDRIKTLT
ncbi:MAG: hypothetical protein A3D53_02990 [Candidatus Magasanikbacteria bacterium RIFCSPHIGHO2_02_FULL_45_10]|nr:MAG: hypothetical protein A3D53_02990 [Candidatus Magasanikbacteria bacterium RIFCSPHIGHO2_02_FULL_45_10]